MSDCVFTQLDARIVKGEKNIFFIYPVVSVNSTRDAVEIFSVELDGHELVPSARGEVKSGSNTFEILPVTIVNPRGTYKLEVKHHPSIGQITGITMEITI